MNPKKLEDGLDWVREKIGHLVQVKRVSTIDVLIADYLLEWDGRRWNITHQEEDRVPRNDCKTWAEAVSLAIGYAVSDAFDDAMAND